MFELIFVLLAILIIANAFPFLLGKFLKATYGRDE